jgi:hypothetical protein
MHLMNQDIANIGKHQCDAHQGLQDFIEERRADGILVNFLATCRDGKSVDLTQTVVLPPSFTEAQ